MRLTVNRYHIILRAMALVALALIFAGTSVAADYLGPNDMVATPDGKTLLISCQDAKQVLYFDIAGKKVAKTVALPQSPTGLALNADGTKLYVSCGSPEGTVAEIDVAAAKVARTILVGHTAVGPSVSPDGKMLYVCNRFDNDVSFVDLAQGKEVGAVPLTREPISSAVSPDGLTLVVINHLPLDPADGYDVAANVALIDTTTKDVKNVRLVNGSSSLRDVCVSPDGKYAYVTHILARYQMPTTQLERGWMNTNALTIIDLKTKERLNTVLVDNVDLGGAVPWAVTTSADGKYVCLTHASSHEVSVINAPGMIDKILKMPPPPEDDRYAYSHGTSAGVPNDLAFLVDLRRRVFLSGGPYYPTDDCRGPRALAIVGTKVYAACYFTDDLAVFELEDEYRRVEGIIPLGPKPKMSIQRKGELLFNDATLCFQHWQSCASCHPDSRVDALNWDLLNDGLGTPKNVRSMLLAHKTPPAMSLGVRASAEVAVRSGIKHIQFAVRPEEEAVAIDEYLKSMQAVPSPLLIDGKLSQSAERGKAIFEKVGCIKCHPAPLFTDLKQHDVNSKGKYDRERKFDTPTLIECWRTAPYMHDGHYTDMKQVFTEGKHGHQGGTGVDKLSDQELNDLVDYVLSL